MKKLVLSLLIFSMYFVTSAQKINVEKVQRDTLMFRYDKVLLVPSAYVVGEFDLAPFSRPSFGIRFSIIRIHKDLAVNKILNLEEFLQHVVNMKETKHGSEYGAFQKIMSRMGANVIIIVIGCDEDRIFMEMEVSEWIE
ncbi:hypothetical protein U1E44_00480 [Arenibacter sp. GZD96]|uniref:hypothetical protein n=1 Tax=Aurantibrevibacter litoralis TaxID=3106030 RepID=UPI002AFEC1AA|nr:hypothetical protein [Arenibacter sp. GZD-96]MEA1784554.1 hypothetical protein [Arenibacter sp. GZD-96]